MPVAAAELTRLAQEGILLTARNTQPGIVVFTDEAQHISLTWEGKGDPAGGDVHECPASLLKNPKFRETVLRGIIIIEDAPDVLQAALDKQLAEWDQRQQRLQSAQEDLERANDRIIGRGVPCIAPEGGKGELCGSTALVMGKNPNERPPLCAKHAHLASQYVLTETGRVDGDGKSETVWQRIALVRS